jgi:hypothetical protein
LQHLLPRHVGRIVTNMQQISFQIDFYFLDTWKPYQGLLNDVRSGQSGDPLAVDHAGNVQRDPLLSRVSRCVRRRPQALRRHWPAGATR